MSLDVTFPSLKCILPFIDVNKRIQLSTSFPIIAKVDKLIPLKIENLQISQSKIEINGIKYIFGEIQDVPDIPENRSFIRTNMNGGVLWSSHPEDVLEPGDWKLEPNPQPSTLTTKEIFEEMSEIRYAFMKALEEYLDDNNKINPMSVFKGLYFRLEWECNLRRMLLGIGCRGSLTVLEKSIVNRNRTEDDLAKKFHRAFEIMKATERTAGEQIGKMEEDQLWILQKLTYPPEPIPVFNQFSIFQEYKNSIFLRRLPEGLTLRKAFKQFSTAIFGGRRNTFVKEFSMGTKGIIGLPVGMKLNVELITIGCYDESSLITAIQEIVEKMDNFLIYNPTSESEVLTFPCIKNCKHLELRSLAVRETCNRLSNLSNETLCVTEPIGLFSQFHEYHRIIEAWVKNPNRAIGSKIIMPIEKTKVARISAAIRSSAIWRSSGFTKIRREAKNIFFRHNSGKPTLLLNVNKEDVRFHKNPPYQNFVCVEVVEL